MNIVQEAIGEEASLVLLSAAGVEDYYQHLGFSKADNAFILKRRCSLMALLHIHCLDKAEL